MVKLLEVAVSVVLPSMMLLTSAVLVSVVLLSDSMIVLVTEELVEVA